MQSDSSYSELEQIFSTYCQQSIAINQSYLAVFWSFWAKRQPLHTYQSQLLVGLQQQYNLCQTLEAFIGQSPDAKIQLQNFVRALHLKSASVSLWNDSMVTRTNAFITIAQFVLTQ